MPATTGAALAFVAAVACLSASAVQVPAGAVRFWYEVPSTVSLHEPVVMAVTFDNRSRGTVGVNLRAPDHTFWFSLRTPSGTLQEAPLSEAPRMQLDAQFEAPADARAGRMDHQLVLDHFLSFAETGVYSLRVVFRGRVEPRDPTAFLIAPAERQFAIRVVPRDPDRLRRFCAAALAELRGAMTSVHFFAGKRLAYVSDPIAIPYLKEAIELDLGYRALWDGFGRIGTVEARQALEELTQSPNPGIANIARNMLARFVIR